MTRRSDFSKYVDRYDGWYERNRLAYLSEVAAIKQLMPKKGLGLEVGVGTGRFSSALNIPFGVDISERSLRIARRREVEVTLATAGNLPFKDGIFDFVLMVIALSFLQNPKRALREMNRTLKQEGRIIMGMVDKNSFLGELYQKRKAEDRPFFREVIAFFSPQEVIDLLKECGFKNFDIYQTLLDPPEDLRNVQQSMEGYGKGGFVVIGAQK